MKMGQLKKLKLHQLAEFDAEAVTQGKCIGCHGGDLTGGMGPGLVGTRPFEGRNQGHHPKR